METQIERIGGRKKVVVRYKTREFLIDCDEQDVGYFKQAIDSIIKEFANDVRLGKDYTSGEAALNLDPVSVSVCRHPPWAQSFDGAKNKPLCSICGKHILWGIWPLTY